MRIFLEPQETLLFRNSRPFDAGEVGYAETVFPPTPETLQGVVRSMIATQYATGSRMSIAEVFSNEDFVNLIGNRDNYGRFRISNIALAKRNGDEIEPLYPVPAHVVEDEDGKFRLKPEPKNDVQSNMPAKMQYLVPEREIKGKIEPVEGWLSLTNLQTVLRPGTDISKLQIIKASAIYEREPHVGIGMDSKRKVTEEGLLYSTQMLRMKAEYGFLITIYIAKNQDSHEKDEQATQTIYKQGFTPEALVRIRNENAKLTFPTFDVQEQAVARNPDKVLKKSGWVTMGGEQRVARFEIRADLAHAIRSKGNLLYLATPAVLSKGWQPAQWTTQTAPIAAAISRYQPIGGWKLDTMNSGSGVQKSLRRCVPAGSVYFFDQPVTLPAPLGGHQEGNNNPTYIGYGITMTGDWKK